MANIDYRTLGDSGLVVSTIGLGCNNFGRTGTVTETQEGTDAVIGAAIDAGKIRTVFVVGEDLTTAGLTAAQLAKTAVIAVNTHTDATTRAAKVVIPGLTVFEKSGAFVNVQWRLQKFAQAIPGPAGLLAESQVLARILSGLGATEAPADGAAIWKSLSGSRPVFAGIGSPADIAREGRALDAAAFAGIAFPETKLLKYAPPAPVAAHA